MARGAAGWAKWAWCGAALGVATRARACYRRGAKMDPEANYEEQRQLYGSTDPDNMERRIELINSMKEWVRHGGFKPAGYKGPAWEPCPNEVESTKLERIQGRPGRSYIVKITGSFVDGRKVDGEYDGGKTLESARAEAYDFVSGGVKPDQIVIAQSDDDGRLNTIEHFSDFIKKAERTSLNEVESAKLERGQSVSDWIAGGGFGPRPESARSNASDPNIQTLIGKADAISKKTRGPNSIAWSKDVFDSMKESIARARASEPGKFESSGDVWRRLHEIVGNGMQDDEAGDVNGPGDHWYGLVLESGIPGAEYAVISESKSGSFDFTRFDTPEEARSEFNRIAAEIAEEFDGETPDSPDDVKFDRDGNEMLDSYIETALSTSYDHSDDVGGEILDRNYGRSSLAADALGEMRGDVFTFLADHSGLIGDKLARAGQDFWLTRNGHGAGFWYGDWPKDAAKTLTDASKVYGSSDLYVGTDGKLHLT